tara:strand:+ start:1707 stop:2312 length:606 start_codon:yes stop_codon:yes gene_type:complete
LENPRNHLLTNKKKLRNKSNERIKYSEIREASLIKNQILILEKVNSFIQNYLNNKQKNEQSIGIYWPLKGEVDLRKIKSSSYSKIALPGCSHNKKINYYPWLNKSLQKDIHGIPAPLNERKLEAKEISILFVPALAIDTTGIRLGYGGGYFDSLRKDKVWRSIPSFVVIPKSCVSRIPLPRDPWDIPFDGWITEEGYTKSV